MRNLFPQSRSLPRRTRSTRTRHISLEPLEGRELLTAVGVPSGLVSWWTADNTAFDLTGRNNATLTGVTYSIGEVSKAFSFNGQNNWAKLGDPSSLAFTSSFTIEGLIKVNALSTNYNFGSIMFRGDDRGGLDPYSLDILPDGRMRFEVDGGQGAADLWAPVPLGQLIHVAATLDDATGAMQLYENGVVVAQTVTTIRPFGPLDPTRNPGVGIGNSNNLASYNVPFNGLIDELSVYNRSLSPSEVFGVYSAGSAGKINSANYFAADYPSVPEGTAGTTTPITFTIQRVGNLAGQAVVNWTTADNTANAGSDYLVASGQVVFQDGQSQATIQVTVNGDNSPEANETFWLNLSTSTPGYAAGGGLGTILNDDVAISVGDTTVTEGDGTIRPLGAYVSAGVGGMIAPYAMIVGGPDGNLYVSGRDSSTVYRFDAVSGNPLPAPGMTGAVFVSVGSGGLNQARDIAFGPDGVLDVVSEGTSSVLRYDPVTGAFLGELVASGSGGLAAPRGLTFRGGYVYVTSVGTETAAPGKDSVLRYDAITGAPAGLSGLPGDAVFIASGSGGLDNPSRLVFDPDGKAYVSSTATTINSPTANSVLRFDGLTGAPAGVSGQTGDAVFVSPGSGGLDGPVAMVFRPDGYLYVTSWRNAEVLRYHATTGAFGDVVVFAGAGGLSNSIDLVFESSGNILVSSKANNQILRFGPGSQAVFTVSLNAPSVVPVTVSYATADGTATVGNDYTSVSGTLTFAPGETTKTVLVPVVNDSLAEPTKTFSLILTNASGATITDGQGVGTIHDDDATKFYVPNDASSSDRTYEYGALGASVENYTLNTGNTAPRGAASTAAGDTVWVVDANKKVYVYNTSGGLLGSWTAGTLSSTATVEGIATNGTDIWIVDAKQDKVFRYTNAASRLSGSQNAASSFNLNSGNTSPKDLVTDGTSLWVVNDSTTDSVFKYTLSGSLVGSWTITGAGSSPTGITLDPTNVGNMWVVDNGTKRVYQFDNAAGLTSGSLSPSTSFALAAGNTNPQGIADPPTGAPLAAVAPRGNVSITRRVKLQDQGLLAGPSSFGTQELHKTQPRPSRHTARSFQAANRHAFTLATSVQNQPIMTEGLTPAGPLSLRSRFTSSRRYS